MYELYIWHRQSSQHHLTVNGAEMMRAGVWPFESCGSFSHCRPPELQLRGVQFQPGSAQSKKQTTLLLLAQVYGGLYLHKNNTISYFSCPDWFVFWAQNVNSPPTTLVIHISCLVLPFSFHFGSVSLFLALPPLNFCICSGNICQELLIISLSRTFRWTFLKCFSCRWLSLHSYRSIHYNKVSHKTAFLCQRAKISLHKGQTMYCSCRNG